MFGGIAMSSVHPNVKFWFPAQVQTSATGMTTRLPALIGEVQTNNSLDGVGMGALLGLLGCWAGCLPLDGLVGRQIFTGPRHRRPAQLRPSPAGLIKWFQKKKRLHQAVPPVSLFTLSNSSNLESSHSLVRDKFSSPCQI